MRRSIFYFIFFDCDVFRKMESTKYTGGLGGALMVSRHPNREKITK